MSAARRKFRAPRRRERRNTVDGALPPRRTAGTVRASCGLKACEFQMEAVMSLGTILLIVLIIILIGAIPTWPYSAGWGYGPSGLVGTVVVILLVLVLLGRL
jgi:hypothetical protein